MDGDITPARYDAEKQWEARNHDAHSQKLHDQQKQHKEQQAATDPKFVYQIVVQLRERIDELERRLANAKASVTITCNSDGTAGGSVDFTI